MNNFFSLEGGEGSGKSTASKLVKEILEKEGITSLVTREPGGDEVAEKLRQIIFDYNLDIKSEVLLFAAARLEHINSVIKPSLEKNQIVICDRYIDSSFAYQTTRKDISLENVQMINNFVIDNFIPHKTFYLKIKPEKALARINGDEREVTRFDKKSLDFHNQVYENYNLLSEMYPDRYVVIDATQTPQEIADIIVKVIKENV